MKGFFNFVGKVAKIGCLGLIILGAVILFMALIKTPWPDPGVYHDETVKTIMTRQDSINHIVTMQKQFNRDIEKGNMSDAFIQCELISVFYTNLGDTRNAKKWKLSMKQIDDIITMESAFQNSKAKNDMIQAALDAELLAGEFLKRGDQANHKKWKKKREQITTGYDYMEQMVNSKILEFDKAVKLGNYKQAAAWAQTISEYYERPMYQRGNSKKWKKIYIDMYRHMGIMMLDY